MEPSLARARGPAAFGLEALTAQLFRQRHKIRAILRPSCAQGSLNPLILAARFCSMTGVKKMDGCELLAGAQALSPSRSIQKAAHPCRQAMLSSKGRLSFLPLAFLHQAEALPSASLLGWLLGWHSPC